MTDVVDSFDRSSTDLGLGTSDSGHLWVPRPSFSHDGTSYTFDDTVLPLGIVSDAYAYTPEPPGTSTDNIWRLETVDTGSADVTVTCWARSVIGSPSNALSKGETIYIIFRWRDADDFCLAFLSLETVAVGPNYFMGIDKCRSGVFSTIAGPSTVAGIGHHDDFLLALTVEGDDIEFAVTPVGSAFTTLTGTDTTWAAGDTDHGLCIHSPLDTHASEGVARVDDWNAFPAVGAGWQIRRLRR